MRLWFPEEGDLESPIPRRTPQQAWRLTQILLGLPTLAGRMTYLLDHECLVYRLGNVYLTDPAEIAEGPRDMIVEQARVPGITDWLSHHTGTPVSRQSLHQYRDGSRQQITRPGLVTALAEFWRIDHRLFDVDTPGYRFTDPRAGIEQLDELERQTHDLMAVLGFDSITPRQVHDSLGSTSDDARRQLRDVLQAIARDRDSHPHS